MESRSTTIEFKNIRFNSDMEDLSQECTAYMKTKHFMARRIVEQQEEIEMLKTSLIYQSGQNIQKDLIIQSLKEQIEFLTIESKNKSTKKEKVEKEDFSICSDDLASSFIYEDGEEPTNVPEKKKTEIETKEQIFNFKKLNLGEECKLLREENASMKKEIEMIKIDYLDKIIELNKIKSDKFILFNELNELVMTLKKIDLEKLNSFYKNNTESVFTRFEMPSAKGIKFNVLSAQSMLAKLLKSELITRKLNLDEKENKTTSDLSLKQVESVLKKTQDDFENVLDRKLSKKNRTTLC